MTFDLPILGCLTLLATVAVVFTSAKAHATARWLFRAGAIAACAAMAGVNIRCERSLSISVMVDVSPSTRGAAFRDARSVETRLTPLLAGRPYTLQYFADGEQPTPVEPPAERTRLPVPDDADAIVLMSDGRFEAPAGLPPVFPVVDPALDSPTDARLRGIVPAIDGVAANVVSPGGRTLYGPDSSQVPPAGPSVAVVSRRMLNGTDDFVGFTPGDAWPENDGLVLPARRWRVERLAFGLDLPGFAPRLSPLSPELAADSSAYSSVSVVVLPTSVMRRFPSGEIGAGQVRGLLTAVREAGVTLVLQGPPSEWPPTLRAISPLSPVPPAGPQSWAILLDASGSMAGPAGGGGRKWQAALAAGRAAVDRLPDGARVSVFAFARDVRTLGSDLSPVDARQRLADAANDRPGGPTGLRAALMSFVAQRSPAATHVLLVTDGDADLDALADLPGLLVRSRVRVDAVVATPSVALNKLCEVTGGQAVVVDASDRWAAALGDAATALPPKVDAIEQWTGHGLLAGLRFVSTGRWPAFAVRGAEVVGGDEATPVIAAWNVGLGRVAAVAGELSPADLAAIATRLERPPVDPRFATFFDERAGVVRLKATDVAVPINGLLLTMRRDGKTVNFEQVGPGEYLAPLRRIARPTEAVVVADHKIVARSAIAGRYPVEFDVVGNDRDALASLATRTGGAIISPGDNRPIPFPRRFVQRPLSPILTPIAAVLLLSGVAAVRGRKS